MMACSAPAFARPECRPVPGDRRCWVVPDALAARLLQDASEDPGLQPDVALWLLELRDLCPVDDAVPGTLGWNPQLKIVYSRAALAPCTPCEDVSLDSGCYDTDSPQLSEKSPASEDPRPASPDSADGADRSLSRARTYENLADANRQAVLEQPESQWEKPSGPASVTATASQAPRMLASNPNTEVKEALRRQVGEEDLSEDDRASASASDSDSDRSVDSLEDDSRVVQRETVLSRLSGTEYHILPAVIEEEEEEEDGEAECEEEGSMVGACGHCSWGWRGVETLVRPCERCGHPSVTRNSLGGSVEVLCLESGSHCTVLWEPNPLFNCGAPCEPDHVCEVHKPSLCRATSDPTLAREPRFVQIDSLDMIGRSWKGRQESTYLCLDALEIAAQECGRLLEQTASVDSGMVFDDDFLALCFEASLLAETCIHDLGRDRPSAEGDVFEAHPRPKFDINAIFDRGGSGPPKPPARKRKRLRVKTVSASEVPPPSSVEDEVVQRRTCSESCEQQNQVSLDEEEIVKSLTTEHREQELLLMTRVSERTKLKRSRSAGARDVGPGATSRRALGPWTSPAEACLSSPELRSTHPLLVECGEPSLTSPAPELGEDVHAESSVVSDGSNELRRKGSVSSDVVAWKQDLLWSRLLSDEEDELATDFMNSDQWFSSSDSKGRVYFFEENSEESSWTLPNVVASSPQTHGLTSRELTDEDDYPPKGSTASLASQLAAQLAKYNKAALERASAERDTVSPTLSNNVERNERGDKLSLRATKSRSMVLVDLCDGKDSKSSAVPRNWPQLFDGDMCVLKEGTLNRTKITENGKKLRKNWASSHVVLTELFLLLFRDAKAFQAMKSSASSSTSARPELCVDLNGALIDQVDRGDKASVTSRKNVFLVSTVLGLQVLFQCDCSQQADDWYNAVHTAIHNLPSGFDSCPRIKVTKEMDRLFAEANSPEQTKKFPRIGRSKSVKTSYEVSASYTVKNKDGSIEDLTVSPAERQTKIRARLKKFFNRRPTMESLVKKGIWKDEPAFGCYLEQVCGSESPRVPLFVQRCIAVIESNVDNMKTDGLYRASGNLSQVQKIRLQVDQNNLSALDQEEDVHVLTGALKLFFRELKEPLIPFSAFSKAIKASTNQNKKEKLSQFRDIVKSLPVANHDTLKFLLKHLLRVTSYQEFNRMHIPNLAIVFGPTLMWPEQESLNMALDLMQQNLVIETFLLDFENIFK